MEAAGWALGVARHRVCGRRRAPHGARPGRTELAVSWNAGDRDVRPSGLRVLMELNDADLRIGAVNDALDLAELTAASGARFLLCGPLTDAFCAEADRRNIATRRAASVPFTRRGMVSYATDVVRWAARLARLRPDIVHLNYPCYGPSLAYAAWHSGIPVVARAGGPYIPGNRSNRWVAAYFANCRAHGDLLL